MKKCILFLLCLCQFSLLCGCGEKPDLILKGQEHLSAQEEVQAQTEEKGSADAETAKESKVIYVYICGAVKKPGVYELGAGSRIYQLVKLAGGMTKKADLTAVNQAESLVDGQMVQIPEKAASGVQDTSGQTAEEAGIAADGKVNINTASAQQLMTLTGIGQTKAEQIISYREKNGSFSKPEDIMQVEGIKEGTYEKIKDSISVQ